MIMSKRRVVITGLGVVSPSGNDLDSFWKALTKGISNVGPITKFDVTNFDIKVAGEVKNFNIGDYGFPFMLN